jgi:hypothetical protein
MHDSEFLADPPTAAEQSEHEQPEQKKRNCGRTGPTSPEGRATSSKNSIKHGSCSQTLILPCESEESWLLLLGRWVKTYQPAEDSLLYDFVLKTAQAEWYRIRAQRNLHSFEMVLGGLSPFNWLPDEIKKHDLLLRYKTTAERSFQREFRNLEQFRKLHPNEEICPAKPAELDEDEESDLLITGEDPTSPTGLSILHEVRNGVENTTVRPYYPRKNARPQNPNP